MKAIFSVGPHGEFGINSGLVYWDRADLQHFKSATDGQTLYCGKNTLKTLPPLPGRTVLALHRGEIPPDEGWVIGGAEVLKSLLREHSLDKCVVSHFRHSAEADVFLKHVLFTCYMEPVETVEHENFDIVTYLRSPV